MASLPSWSFAEMWGTRLLSLLPGPLWPTVEVRVRVTSKNQIELCNLSQGIIIINYLKPDRCMQVVYANRITNVK